MVSVQYERVLDSAQFSKHDLSSFRSKQCTGAPLSVDLKRRILAQWPGGLQDAFGMSELGALCILDAAAHPDKLHTVGRPAKGSEVRIIDGEGREVPQGATGEVVGRTPSMMTGYHRQRELSGQAEWHDARGERFLRTGDLGYLDVDGFLVLVGRQKDVIISGGFNIYPSDIEAVLLSHPAVSEAVVVGVPSQRWGESPAAFVVLRDGAQAGNHAGMDQRARRQDPAPRRPAGDGRPAAQRRRQGGPAGAARQLQSSSFMLRRLLIAAHLAFSRTMTWRKSSVPRPLTS